jgi:hypothetical protein
VYRKCLIIFAVVLHQATLPPKEKCIWRQNIFRTAFLAGPIKHVSNE